MKRFFRLVSMLAVAGLTFAYTSCTDYSEDVNRLDERIDGHVADVNKQVEELKNADTKLQTSIDAANKAIEALQANTESLQTELTKLSEKHDADIKALEATHAADKAALEKALADKAAELKTALETLDAKYAQKVSDLEAAYKQADTELKNQILQNSTKITTLQNDVKNINEVVIPAVKKQIEDLAANVEATYATKVELTEATAKVTELINSEVAKLTARLESVESRLTTLEAAHKALKESFEETKAAHAAAIKALEGNVATLTGDVAELKTAVRVAKDAADKAQEAADAAQAAADKAQETADAAVTAAATAQAAAEAAQATATEALGKVDALIEALGVYAQKGVLEAKIGEIVEKTIALAAKDVELDGKIDNLANVVAELSETLQTQVKEIYNYVDAQDAKKLNIDDFADAFKAAYEARFADDFAGAWAEKFQPAFDEAFKAAWAETFQPAFDEAFKTAWEKNFQPSFDEAFTKAIAAAIEDNGVVGDKINEKVNAAKTELEGKISDLEAKISAQLSTINTKVGDILLVVGDLAERIQSITFVPEYDDFAATLYYYVTPVQGPDGKNVFAPISDKKTVVAKFEVYPKSQAVKVAEMLKSGEGASLVAVPLKASYTRGAAEAAKAEIKSAVAENGVVSIEAVFGADVPYDFDYNTDWNEPKNEVVSFAISLRVESAAETAVRDGVVSETVDAGKYIESAYVPVEISENSLVYGFCLYDFVNEKFFENGASVKKQWSEAPAKWNYFAGYDYAVLMYDRDGKECVKTLADAADLMNVTVEDITPSFTVYAEPNNKDAKKFFDPQADNKGYVTSFNALADCNIAMNESAVKADVKNAVGSKMTHYASFKVANVGTVCNYNVAYEIIRRQVNFNLKPYDSNEIAWTYAKAVELSSGKTFAEAYDQPLVFNECGVERVDENETLIVKLGEILKLTPKYEVTINGEEATVNNPIEITMVAQDVEDVAKVVIPGGAYKFAQGKDSKYVITAVYAVDDNQTDYNVSFEYTLGAMPKDQTVVLPNKAINFKSGETSFGVSYTVDEYRKPLVDAIGSYFKDAITLWASVNEKEVTKDVAIYKNKSRFHPDLNSSTTLNVLAGGVKAVIDRQDLKSFDDKFGFVATNKTWYGVTYTFTTGETGVTFVKPSYVLAPAPDRLNADWTGTINYQETTARYILQQDIDLSKYVIVKDSKDASKALTENALTIDYAALTKEDAAKGILRVPAIATPTVKVVPSTDTPQFPTIEESMINWLTRDRETSFTARELEISAVLKLEGIELDKQTIKLSTARPITNFSFDNFVETVTTKNATVNLWNQMVIEGVREPGLNIVNQKAASFELAMTSKPVGVQAFQGPYSYDCVVTFPDKKDVEVYVGGEKQNIYNQEKFTYDPAKGTITFTGDLGDLVKPVEFKFTATLNYVLDYNHKQPLTAPVSVTFQK